jgi:hypothetical protein
MMAVSICVTAQVIAEAASTMTSICGPVIDPLPKRKSTPKPKIHPSCSLICPASSIVTGGRKLFALLPTALALRTKPALAKGGRLSLLFCTGRA